jgi:Tol biopolymer transport system component
VRTPRRAVLVGVALLAVALGAAGWLVLRPRGPLPEALSGGLVFVSDRDGTPALYWRRLPRDRERQLTFGSEGVDAPRISPDGTRVAFSMNGRIGVVAVASGESRVLTLGIDWKDETPSWLPDGGRLVVSARRRSGERAGLQVLALGPDGSVGRHPLTSPRGHDDTEPVASPDGSSVVFVREDHLMRVDLADGSVRRVTGGFRLERSPRFLPSGRIVCAWSEGKRHGIDTLDPDGGGRETIVEGDAYYRTVAPSPDGRFLAVTLSWDLALRPLSTLLGRRTEEVRLLDVAGRRAFTLEASWRYGNHSPDWCR